MNINLIQIGGSHWYKAEGIYMPSVTTYLKTFPAFGLYDWKAMVGFEKANEISTESAKDGTLLHQTINKLILNPKLSIDTSEWKVQNIKMLEGFRQFLKEYKPEILESEKMLYNKKLMTAGTMDLKIRIKKKNKILRPGVYIVDIKSSKELYTIHDIQLAIYHNLDTWMILNKIITGVKADGCAILHLKKQAIKKFSQVKKVDINRIFIDMQGNKYTYVEVFKACQLLWNVYYGFPKGPSEKRQWPKSFNIMEYKNLINLNEK